jgi:hypothetical protein
MFTKARRAGVFLQPEPQAAAQSVNQHADAKKAWGTTASPRPFSLRRPYLNIWVRLAFAQARASGEAAQRIALRIRS